MTKKSELIQARVDRDLKRNLEKTASKKEQSVAEFLRNLVEEATAEDETGTLKHKFLRDIYGAVEDPGDEPGVREVLETNWESLRNHEDRVKIRNVIENDGPVLALGQGSSLSVAKWFAARLEESGIVAEAKTPEQVSRETLDDHVLVFVSRSGETESLKRLAKKLTPADGTTIGFTQRLKGEDVDEGPEETELWRRTKYHIELPLEFDERLVYPTKSVLLQMVILQAAVLEPEMGKETFLKRLDHLNRFVRDNVSAEATPDGDAVVEGLEPDSQFEQLAHRLERVNDQDLNLIVSGLGWFAPLGSEMVQKYAEFLHFDSTYEDLRSIRHRLINVLYRENTYLTMLVPYRDQELPSSYYKSMLGRSTDDPESANSDESNSPYVDSSDGGENDYGELGRELFRKEHSIDDMLKIRGDPARLRLVAFTFNPDEPRSHFEKRCQNRSEYGDDSVIWLDSRGESPHELPEDDPMDAHDDLPYERDEGADDLVMMMAFQLYTYAILDVLWDYDDKVKNEVYRNPQGETDH